MTVGPLLCKGLRTPLVRGSTLSLEGTLALPLCNPTPRDSMTGLPGLSSSFEKKTGTA